jgi:hypothetical protein
MPSENKLCLFKLTGVNRKKFKKSSQEMYRVEHYLYDNRYVIAPPHEGKEEPNCTSEKIAEFPMSDAEITYQFTFFGNEIGARTIPELIPKIEQRLKHCQTHIIKARTAEVNLRQLLGDVKKLSKNKHGV